MSDRPALRALAEQAGILDGYDSALDGRRVETTDATREALLAAMGHDGSSEAAAERALAAIADEREAAWVDPLRVVVDGRPEARRLSLRTTRGAPAVALSIESEGGERREIEAPVGEDGELALPELGPGRHEITFRLPGGEEARQRRWIVPERCSDAAERLGERGGFGLWANLYAVRSAGNWGFGHLGDLAELARRAGAEGAAFVGVNPLHALSPGELCPYLPVSRLFRSPLYLDPERIPELADCPDARRRIASDAFRRERERLRAASRLDAGAVGALLGDVLVDLHRCFAAGAGSPERRRAFERYRHEQGDALRDFATWSALADREAGRGGARDWRRWPAELRAPGSAAVRAFCDAHAGAVERHAWIQFELDRQLGLAAEAGRGAGLALGLYTDLALGSDPGGSDAWAFPGLLAQGVRVGAPPDAFSREGQEWGFPPPDPAALRRGGLRFWDRLLRAAFAHAGALRLDHAMGLERLFWIPEGRPPSEGAYVRYPREELLGLVALESRRHDAAVIAEDLGTLPEGFSEALAARGILSSRVLLFERDPSGFRPADHYPQSCLVTANTHDLPPLAALAGEADLQLRRRAGHLPDDRAFEEARAERAAERAALTERLRADGWLSEEAPDPARLAAAVTAFLCSTPARLVGISLDDLAGEAEPMNLPGVPGERHASWTRRLHADLDEVLRSETARATFEAVPAERRADAPGAGPEGTAAGSGSDDGMP